MTDKAAYVNPAQNADDVAADDALADMEKWVLDHGSTRLQKAQEAGLLDRCWTLYRQERLRLERPGWVLITKDMGRHKDIRNPSEVNLDAFLDAREEWPAVEMFWLQPEGCEGEAWFRDLLVGRTIGISVLNYRAHSDGSGAEGTPQ